VLTHVDQGDRRHCQLFRMKMVLDLSSAKISVIGMVAHFVATVEASGRNTPAEIFDCLYFFRRINAHYI
jgi:hypothetical protein